MAIIRKGGLIAESQAAVSPKFRIKTGTFTRDSSIASGNQSITGVGFKPFALLINSGASGSIPAASWGASDGTAANDVCQVQLSGGNMAYTAGVLVYYEESGISLYTGSISSFDADGFTITWTKFGSPVGLIGMTYVAMG